MPQEKKSSTINETARRANRHFRFSETVSSEKSSQTENISVLRKPKSALHNTHPVPARGAYHDRHDRGAGRGGRWQCRKANGMRAYGEVVWSRRRGAGVNAPGGNSFQGATEAKEPFSGEITL